ncbi:MAG: PEGA domain-containing protein [Fervidobacterium sp.]
MKKVPCALNKYLNVLFFLIFLTFPIFQSSIALALTVFSNNGAIVYFNDKLIGTIKNESISFEATFPGVLKIVKPGYMPFEIMVTQDGTVVALLSLPAYLSICTSPADAQVFVNNQKISTERDEKGFIKITLGAGMYNLKVNAPGYVEKQINLTLREGEEKELCISLKKTVSLSIKLQNTSTNQNNSQIFTVSFDGTDIMIPTEMEVTPGLHKLILPDGFYKKIQQFSIPAVENFEITVDARRVYNLNISGEPDEAYAKINGEIYKLPININLPEGKYDVKIFSHGYKDSDREIILFNDTVINYSLEPLELYEIALKDKNYTIEFNGFSVTKLPRTVGIVSLKDNLGKIVWLGFSDGKLEGIPSTIPVIVSSTYQLTFENLSIRGPAIFQIPKGKSITLYSRNEGTRIVDVSKMISSTDHKDGNGIIVFDDEKSCLMNIFSKTPLDVFLDGKYIGKTPIYLHESTIGNHTLVFKRDGTIVHVFEVIIKTGTINEIVIDKQTKQTK